MILKEGQAKRRIVYLMISAMGLCLAPNQATAAPKLDQLLVGRAGDFQFTHIPTGFEVHFSFGVDRQLVMTWTDIGWRLKGQLGCMDNVCQSLRQSDQVADSLRTECLHLRPDGTFLYECPDSAGTGLQSEMDDSQSGIYAVFQNPANGMTVIAFLMSDDTCLLGVISRQGVVETDFGVFRV